MSLSKKEKTPWIKSRKKPGPKTEEKDKYSFDKSKKKELAARIGPPTSAIPNFWQRIRHQTYDRYFCSVGIQVQSNTELQEKLARVNSWPRPRFVWDRARRWTDSDCLILRRFPQLFFVFAGWCLVSFVFLEAFLLDFTFPILLLQITFRRRSTAKWHFPRISMGYFCCESLGSPKLVFHWSAAWPHWQPLWWGVISFQNFRSVKLGLYFCVYSLASSELIGCVDLTDSSEIWPKCSLVINAPKCVGLFWYSKYFSSYTLSCDEVRQIFYSPSSK